MNSWYRIIKEQDDEENKIKTHIMVFETDDKDIAKQIEAFYRNLIPSIGNSYHRNAV